jgi:hypothetical protein
MLVAIAPGALYVYVYLIVTNYGISFNRKIMPGLIA